MKKADYARFFKNLESLPPKEQCFMSFFACELDPRIMESEAFVAWCNKNYRLLKEVQPDWLPTKEG